MQYFTKAQYFSLIKQSVHDAKIAECFYYLEQDTIARSHLKGALLIDPDCFEAYDVLSSLDWDDDNKKLSSYYEMIRIKPDYGFGYFMIGRLLEAQDKINDALHMYYTAFEIALLSLDNQFIIRCSLPKIVKNEVIKTAINFIKGHLDNPIFTLIIKYEMKHYRFFVILVSFLNLKSQD